MNEAEWNYIECRQSLSYNWIYRNCCMKQKSIGWRWVQLYYDVSYVLFEPHTKKEEKQKKIEVFLTNIADIERVLTSWKKTDLRTILSDHYHEFLNVFNCTIFKKLPLLRREDTDHWIELKEIDEKELKVFWDSLYNMMREKLLMLHKTLTELLNKQFIQVSNLFAAVSVLFIWKSEDELQFCVNYCDLNWIT